MYFWSRHHQTSYFKVGSWHLSGWLALEVDPFLKLISIEMVSSMKTQAMALIYLHTSSNNITNIHVKKSMLP